MTLRKTIAVPAGRLTVILSLIAFACQSPAQQPNPLSQDDVAQLELLVDVHVQAGLEGDWETFFGLNADDAVWMRANAPAVEGLAAIRDLPWVRGIDYEVTPLEIDGRDDLAYIRGTYRLLLDREGATEDTGKFIWILRKQSAGSWLLTRMIGNSDLPVD